MRPPRLQDVHANGRFVITGGLGSLGLLSASSLVRQGVQHLQLLGRTGRGALSTELLESAALVTLEACDVTTAEGARVTLPGPQGGPPLQGVLHAAGVLADALLGRQTASSMRT